MSVLIVQLSDVHLVSAEDEIFLRAQRVVDTIASEIDASVKGCVLINCGDSTQSGQENQYTLALRLFASIRDKLTERVPSAIPIILLAIPGNHDCDFSGDQTARDVLLGQSIDALTKSSVLPLILAPQNGFFDFSSTLVGRDNSLLRERPFYHSVDLNLDGALLRFHLLNSAWASSRKEMIGSLKFPTEHIQATTSPEAAYSIAAIHHPSNWFSQPDTTRQLRDRLEAISDVVLTGHEHQPLAYNKQIFGNDDHMYVEGGVLLERGNVSLCSFNLIRLDFSAKKRTVTTYAWSAQGFFRAQNGAPTSELTTNRSRIDRHQRLSKTFESFLDEIDIPINHPRRERIRLSEIFVYPDLRIFKDTSAEVLKRTRSESVIDTLASHERVLVTGSEKSGKSSLARRLYADFHRRGRSPLLLVGHLARA